MYIPPEQAVVQKAGGRVEWVKEKGPQHIVTEYWIFCWLGKEAFSKYKPILDRIQACSRALGSLAIIWRRYDAERKSVQEFREKYLSGPVTVPFAEWNGHHLLLEQVVVDTESFFWCANRLLTNVALTLNFFFKKVSKNSIPKGERIKSHASLVESKEILEKLPLGLQELVLKLNAEVAGFRNVRVEHDMDFWRRESTKSVHQLGMSVVPEAALHLEWSDRPLSEIWISMHDYVTEVAKFLGPQLK